MAALRERARLLAVRSRVGIELLELLFAEGGRPALALAPLLLFSSLIPALNALTLYLLIDGVISGASSGDLWSAASGPLLLMVSLLLASVAVDHLVAAMRVSAAMYVDGAIRRRIRVAVGAPLTIEHLEQQTVRDLAELPVAVGERSIGDGAVAQLSVVTYAVGSAASFLIVASWSLPWAVVALGLILVGRRLLAGDTFERAGPLFAAAIPRQRAGKYWQSVAGTVAGAKEIRVFGFAEEAVTRFRDGHIAGAEAREALLKPTIARIWWVCLLPTAALVGPLLFAATALSDGVLSPPEFSLILGGLTGLQLLFILSGDDLLSVGVASAQLTTVGELERTTEGRALPARADALPAAAGVVRFEAVSFRYPGATTDVLRGIDLEIDRGESLAIVGENGVGKTTLIKLLARVYRPTSGRITLDGVDIATIDPAQWRRELAVIMQSFARLPLSLRANVALAAPDHPDSLQICDRVARDAGMDELLHELPSGWDTPLSREFRGGVDLSGGQWQRVVLARALYAAAVGAHFLVLDEPTAHLDVRAEVELFDRLLESAKDAGAVIVSHRYSTVRRASRIAVLEAGRVAELGNHDELMARAGIYARLYRLQADAFVGTPGDDTEPDAAIGGLL